MSITPYDKLSTADLGELLTRELLIVGGGWMPRTAIHDAVIEMIEAEADDLDAAGVEVPDELSYPTNQQLYRALRAAGVPESRRQGYWGFVVRLRDETGPEFARFLAERVRSTELRNAFVPQTELYNAYSAGVPAHLPRMSMTQFIAAMEAEGYVHVRRWLTESTGGRMARRTKFVWGFRELWLAEPNAE